MKKAPKIIMGFLEDPSTWDRTVFETLVRQEVETLKGELNPTDELLLGMLVMTVETLMEAHAVIQERGYIYKYNAGEAVSAHMKVRTECLDKCVKILKEMDMIAKSVKKPTEVDELFASA